MTPQQIIAKYLQKSSEVKVESEKVSYPGPSKWNRNLHTCAQDVRFTRTVTI
jgi:hypothetical protein